MKRRWNPNDRVVMPTGRPGIIEKIYRDTRDDVLRMVVRYTDTIKLDDVDVRADLPRVTEKGRFA